MTTSSTAFGVGSRGLAYHHAHGRPLTTVRSRIPSSKGLIAMPAVPSMDALPSSPVPTTASARPPRPSRPARRRHRGHLPGRRPELAATRAQSDAYHRARRARTRGDVGRGCRRWSAGLYAVEADLSEAAAPARIFSRSRGRARPGLDPRQQRQCLACGLVRPSSRRPGGAARGRALREHGDDQLLVDARGGALMIAELAASVRRHGLGWGRIVSLTSGGPYGLSR